MDTERRFPRFAKQLEGKVFLRACWKECTTVDVSRNGICLRFGETKTPSLGSTIGLKIPSFKALKPIYIIGILKWTKKEASQFVGGVELNAALSEYEWVKLRNHFNFSPQ
jgi:hypothetical protein